LEDRQIQMQEAQTAFNNRLSRKSFALGEQAQEFNQEQFLRQNRIDNFSRFMGGITNRINTNNAVKQQFASRGYL
jgi:hypothetical protein